MSQPQFLPLLRNRKFAPLFWTQFLGGFNDNLFKQAMNLLIVFRLAASGGADPAMLTALGGATFVAPFILLSGLAGRLADRFDKAMVARRLKLAELGLMILAAVALISGSMLFLFGVLFLLGCQAALFGPVKYSLLPAHLRDDELVTGNALVEGATFMAILIGSIAGGLLIGSAYGAPIVAGSVIAIGAIGYVTARLIPPAPPVAKGPPLSWNLIRDTRDLLVEAKAHRGLWLCILGISWFWVVGASVLALVTPLARDVLGGDEAVASALLAVFSVGIAVGSLACARYLNGEITARPVPFAGLAMTAVLLVLALVVAALPPAEATGLAASAVLTSPRALLLIGTLFALSVVSGFYAVPLYAILQHDAPEAAKARMIGANNVINSLMMVAGAVVLGILTSVLQTPPALVLLILAGLNLVAAIIAIHLLSRIVMKSVVRTMLTALYRVEVRGLEHVAAAGERRVIVANHLSFLDGLVVAAFLPGDPVFAVDTRIAQRWWVKPILWLVDFAPIDPTNPMAMKFLVRQVEAGRPVVIFPEGRLTVTGSLMKVYDGPGMIADKTGADLIPVRLDGLQHTFFTRLKGRVARRALPKVRMSVLPPRRLALSPALKGRDRRRAAGRELYDVLSDALFATTDIAKTLMGSLIESCRLNGRGFPIVEDVNFEPVSYGKLLTGAFVLGRRLTRLTTEHEVVGVLLPNSAGALVGFFALHAYHRVPAMLNPTAGAAGIAAACQTAGIKTILCARQFVAKAKLEPLLEQLAQTMTIIYLDDLRTTLGPIAKLRGLLASFMAGVAYREGSPDAPAVVLFTSGSEGAPKGVVLSHRNIQANRHQVGARIAFNRSDVCFNALPMFHSFGLTIGTLLPVLAGVRTFLYPSPLHYRIVPELVYQTNATVMFGTDTFLRGYARMANPYDFHTVRLIGAGAEKVSDETRKVWSERFGVRILEGYGATETAPVIAFNTPMHAKAGTVGRFMPGISHRLEPVPGIAEGGRLIVKGPNVMLGYFKTEKPGVLEAPVEGWYDTGDIVTVDEEGFVSIRGRAKRFAKIAGEMVSLAAVEEAAARFAPEARHAAIARPDARKGEQVVLVTEAATLTRQRWIECAGPAGLPEIMIPREVIHVSVLPTLATGKTDYAAITRMFEDNELAA
ncbi:acyl-[ACP]--phospholipid O-acyltransferase [Microvirga arabica]|uniref:acyl-[ACP]--phospholipid O-acyltransferase n=1 Tax=Microvirga arabica TaxID=1128671 RepID=UPI0019395BEC|nr:acyl-[ACP]--phospholipid O-acyltransferase [Microvirga arabica]MBM1172046.1 acyl-[ACP]--phospholipid O-acyltransferase [Microvirga arabica]